MRKGIYGGNKFKRKERKEKEKEKDEKVIATWYY